MLGSRPRINSAKRATSYFAGSDSVAAWRAPLVRTMSTVRLSRSIASRQVSEVNTVGWSGLEVSARKHSRHPPPAGASPT